MSNRELAVSWAFTLNRLFPVEKRFSKNQRFHNLWYNRLLWGERSLLKELAKRYRKRSRTFAKMHLYWRGSPEGGVGWLFASRYHGFLANLYELASESPIPSDAEAKRIVLERDAEE